MRWDPSPAMPAHCGGSRFCVLCKYTCDVMVYSITPIIEKVHKML